MRPERFHSDTLLALLRAQPIATMEELKEALGTRVDMTVFRKLREIPYLASYSHRGRFYALRETAAFDARGLWRCRDAHFSQFGSLIDTAERFVLSSERGYGAPELATALAVEVKDTLLGLVEARRLARERVAGRYLYCAPDRRRRKQQLLARSVTTIDEPFGAVSGPGTSDEVRAAVLLFLSTLNERQRRLYAGLESLRIGRGGDRRLAEWTGLDVHTVAKGRQELARRDLDLERIRRRGGGRQAVEKKRRK